MSHHLDLPLLIGLILIPLSLNGESVGYDKRYGLTRPQHAGELPQSASMPTVAAKHEITNKKEIISLTPVGNSEWRLSDGWKLIESDMVESGEGSLFSSDYDTSRWYNAIVPGTVLTSLVEEGMYPDPYYGLNNLAIPDSLSRKEWWYRIEFDCPERNDNSCADLCFEGINYRADVWLNGHKLGRINGAFSRGIFDVSTLLCKSNILAVKIYPPNNPGIPHEQSAKAGQGHNGGVLCLDGPTFISSEGWDWIPGIRDRNIGIWQPVTLRYTGNVKIGDTHVITDLPLPDTSSADLIIKTAVENRSDKSLNVVLSASLDNKKLLEIPLKMQPREKRKLRLSPKEFEKLHLQNPTLWWPNGYGEQILHHLKLTVHEKSDCLDEQTTSFGIREYSYIVSADDANDREHRFEFYPTNDFGSVFPFDFSHRRSAADGGVVVPSFANGFVPDSTKIITKDTTSPYLVICCNGERIFCRGGNWGMDDGMKRVSRQRLEPALRLHRDQGFNIIRNWTGETTEELFYTLCDEYGMMVWNDFWISTEGANLEPTDEDLFMNNALETVRRFRNHPSIAIWCPRNEGYAPRNLDKRLSQLIMEEDGTRYYSPNSRYMNLRTSGPWHYLIDQKEYANYHAKGFTTELGTPSVPTAESMRKFIPYTEQWPISDTWYYHDLHSGLPHYCNSIDSLYGKSESLDEFCSKAQLINYNSYRTMFESWNSKMWNSTSGMLIWMSHPAWPSVEWQTYSWDLETPGAYFGCKKACERLHIQFNLADSTISVINTTRFPIDKGYVKMSCVNSEGKIIKTNKICFKNILSNSATTLSDTLVFPHELFMVRLELFSNGKQLSLNDYMMEKDSCFLHLNALAPATIKMQIKKRKDRGLTFEVENTSAIPAIAVKFNIRDLNTNKAILPVYFTDGYINLIPGEKRTLDVEFQSDNATYLSAEGFNLVPQKLEIK